ncbi:MAG: deoxyribose-phosphate aldolase [Phycisphaerae bacterium]|nr:deoxyribose-phosphate aldolase [Phycisphaerae bacterium]
MDTLPSPAELASKIDHTLLKAEATSDQIEQLCGEGKEHGFAAVCINSVYAWLAARCLADSPTGVCCVVGFPLGATPTAIKVAEARRAIDDGACEIDMVIHIGAMRGGQTRAVREDVAAVAEVVHRAGDSRHLKVILECGALTDEQIVLACELCGQAGADFVKTSTGMHASGGATVESVRLLRAHAGRMRVKAAGGIRSLDDALAMIRAGADRLGTSSGVAIMAALRGRGTGG